MSNMQRQIVVGALVSGVVTSMAFAQCDTVNERLKTMISDSTDGDEVGFDAAIEGNAIVLGAPLDDTMGEDAGAVYLLKASDGAVLAKIFADDADPGDEFGAAVAIRGGLVIIGAALEDEEGEDAGAVYIVDIGSGIQTKITAPDAAPFDEFGGAVDISDVGFIVGATGDDDNGPLSGSAYVFGLTAGFPPLGKLLPTPAAASYMFGESVAISNSACAVASTRDDSLGDFAGRGYLFDAFGTQIATLDALDADPFDEFGRDIAMTETRVIIGAPGDSELGMSAGAAYVFDVPSGVQLQKLTADDGDGGDFFGAAVDIEGNTAVVGAFFDDQLALFSGSAYLMDASTGTQLRKFLSSDGADSDLFAWSIGLSGTTVICGARWEDDQGGASGSGYIFDTTPNCPADCAPDNGNGTFGNAIVNIDDLLATINEFGPAGGPCDSAPCNADGSIGNGQVNIDDLLNVINSFGPCG